MDGGAPPAKPLSAIGACEFEPNRWEDSSQTPCRVKPVSRKCEEELRKHFLDYRIARPHGQLAVCSPARERVDVLFTEATPCKPLFTTVWAPRSRHRNIAAPLPAIRLYRLRRPAVRFGAPRTGCGLLGYAGWTFSRADQRPPGRRATDQCAQLNTRTQSSCPESLATISPVYGSQRDAYGACRQVNIAQRCAL